MYLLLFMLPFRRNEKLQHLHLANTPIVHHPEYPKLIWSLLSNTLYSLDGRNREGKNVTTHFDLSFLLANSTDPTSLPDAETLPPSICPTPPKQRIGNLNPPPPTPPRVMSHDIMIQTSPKTKIEVPSVPASPSPMTSKLSEETLNKLQVTLDQLTTFLQQPPKQDPSSLPPPEWKEMLQALSQQPQAMLKEIKDLKQHFTKKTIDPMPTIMALEKEMEHMRHQEQKLVEEARCLKEEIQSKQQAQEQIENEKQLLMQDVEIKSKQLQSSESKIAKIKSQAHIQLMKIMKELEKVTLESEKMQLQIQDLQQSKHQSERETSLLRQKYKEKVKWERHQSAEKDKRIQSLTQDLHLLQERERISALHLNFRDLSVESKNVRDQQWFQYHAQDLEKSRQRISELEKLVHDTEIQSKQTESQLQCQVHALQSQLTTIQAKYNEEHAQSMHFESQWKSTLQQRDQLTQLVQKQQAKLHELNDQLHQLEQQYEEENLQLHQQFKQAQAKANDENQSLMNQLKEAQHSIQLSQQSWEIEKNTLNELFEQEKKSRVEHKESMQNELQRMQSQLVVKEKMLEDQNDTIKQLKLNLTSKVNEFQTLSKDVEAFKEIQYELHLRDQELNRLDALAHAYKEERDNLQQELEQTQQKLDERNESITQIEKETMKLQGVFQKKLDQMEEKHVLQVHDHLQKMEAMQIHLNRTLSHQKQQENELEHCRLQLKQQHDQLEQAFQLRLKEHEKEIQSWKEKYLLLQSKWQSISELVGSSSSSTVPLAPVQ